MLVPDLLCEVQGYINRSNLPTGLGARRVSWEHVENMELRCALVIRAPVCSVLCVSEHRALCLRAPCSVSQSTVLCVSEHRALCHRALCSGSQSTVLWFSDYQYHALCLRDYSLFIACLLKGSQEQYFSFRHSYSRHFSRRLKKL